MVGLTAWILDCRAEPLNSTVSWTEDASYGGMDSVIFEQTIFTFKFIVV